MACKCPTDNKKGYCAKCSNLRVVFMIDKAFRHLYPNGNPVYYSFLSEEKKHNDLETLAKKMIDRLGLRHASHTTVVKVYNNLLSGRPEIFTYKRV